MKFVFLVIVFCFGVSNAKVAESSAPNLRIGLDRAPNDVEASVADVNRAYQNAQRGFGEVSTATCPECAHFPNLPVDMPSELHGVKPKDNTEEAADPNDPNQI